MPFTRPRHWLRWLIGAVVVLAALAAAGPFIYIYFFNSAPSALSLSPSGSGSPSSGGTATATTAASGPVAGSWSVGSGSVVGYRVNEVLLGQNAIAVGRTTSVTGHLTIQGTAATAASFSVPMATVHSDKSQRDDQVDGRIMDVAQYPTATFTLTSPVDLAPLPATGAVTITLTAERVGAQLKVAGQIPVLFSDYNIQNPSLGGFVTTQDHGLLEFLLVFARA